MKEINFIKTIPARRHKEIITWWKLSLFSCLAMLVGIIIIQLWQIKNLYALKTQHTELKISHKEFHATIEKKQKLKRGKEELQEKIALLQKYQKQIKNTAQYLSYLSSSKLMHVDTLKVDQNSIEIQAQSQQIIEALQWLENLSNSSYFEDVKLTNLHTNNSDNSTTRFTCKGSLKNNIS